MSGFDTEVPPELPDPVRINPVQAALNDHAALISHMTADETELLGYLDEYEAARYARGRLADATAELAAFRIAEHYSLIRKAIYRRSL